MPKPIHSPEPSRLRDRLRREAAATRPAFSESLHQEIMRALDESKPEVAAAQSHPATTGRRAWLSIAVVAASLLAIVVAWQVVRDILGPSAPPAQIATEDETQRDFDRLAEWSGGATQKVDAWLDSALSPSQWAYLDHDARAVFATIADDYSFLTSWALADDSSPNAHPASNAD